MVASGNGAGRLPAHSRLPLRAGGGFAALPPSVVPAKRTAADPTSLSDRVADWVLGIVSPRRAAARRHFRRFERDLEYHDAIDVVMRLRGYRAARRTDGATPWTGSARSADGEILMDLYAMRNRSRELSRDDPIGCGIFKTFVNNVIGRAGLNPQADTEDADKNDRIEAVFRERCDSLYPGEGRLSYAAAQRLLYRRILEDGEILIIESVDPDDPKGPLWFEIIEADRLGMPAGMPVTQGIFPGVAPGNHTRNGIERDIYGRVHAYHILKRHPGDVLPPVAVSAPWEFYRVEAERVYHLHQIERPGQSRGVPLLHAVLQDLHDLDLLLLASLKRVQIAACLSVFVTSPQAMEDLLDVTAEKYGYRIDQDLEPGMIFKLHPGESVETLLPNFPSPELTPFIVQLARRIGAAVGVSWQTVLRDFSQSTYSSARTDLLETWQTYEIEQSEFESALAWQRVRVLEYERLRGDPRLRDCSDEDLREVSWIPPGRHWVDPEKEAKALQLELEMGITTRRDVAASRGRDWQSVLQQRLTEEVAESEARKAMGLPPAPAPGAAAAAPAPEQESDAERDRGADALWHQVVAHLCEFVEEDHPRDEDGKFIDKGSEAAVAAPKGDSGHTGGGAADSGKYADESGRPTAAGEARLRELGMVGTMPPKNASDIVMADLSNGPEFFADKAMIKWKQPSEKTPGRISDQYRYTHEYHVIHEAEKWAVVEALEPHINRIKDDLRTVLVTANTVEKRQAATVAAIIAETGLRPTDDKTSVSHGHYGAASLLTDHVIFSAEEAHLVFVGKEGVLNTATVRDPENVAALKEAHAAAKEGGPLFAKTNSTKAGAVLKRVVKSAGITMPVDAKGKKQWAKLKDLRTVKATQTARVAIAEFTGAPPPWTGNKTKDVRAISKAIMLISARVGKVLNNGASQARDNYVHPKVWEEWQAKLKAGMP